MSVIRFHQTGRSHACSCSVITRDNYPLPLSRVSYQCRDFPPGLAPVSSDAHNSAGSPGTLSDSAGSPGTLGVSIDSPRTPAVSAGSPKMPAVPTGSQCTQGAPRGSPLPHHTCLSTPLQLSAKVVTCSGNVSPQLQGLSRQDMRQRRPPLPGSQRCLRAPCSACFKAGRPSQPALPCVRSAGKRIEHRLPLWRQRWRRRRRRVWQWRLPTTPCPPQHGVPAPSPSRLPFDAA